MAKHIHIHLGRTKDADGPAHAPAGSSKGGQFVSGGGGASKKAGGSGKPSYAEQVKAGPKQSSVDWDATNGDWKKSKQDGRELVQRTLQSAKSGGDRTDAALALKKQAEAAQKNGSYLGAVVVSEINDFFDRLK